MLKRRKINPASQIAISFLATILVGTFFLCLPISNVNGQWLSFIDGLFMSTSSVCVTGLVVRDLAVHFTLFGQIVTLLLIQIGGLGFITLTALAFFAIGKKISYQTRVAMQESLNQNTNQGVVKLVKNVIILVFSIEFVGFILFLPSLIPMYGWGQGIFKSLFLAISAFCNAGMDVLGVAGMEFSSLSAFAQNSLILLPVMLLIVVGGIGYIVLFEIGKKFKKQKFSFHSKLVLVTTAVLIFGGALIFAILEWNNPNTIGNMNVWDKIVNSLFLSITNRTAGFATYDLSKLSQGSAMLSILLMFIGGSPASTAGGIKTTTFIVLLIALFKSENSNGNITFCRRSITPKVVKKCVRVIGFAGILIVISTFMICVFENGSVSILEAIFECVSALSTVGLTLGVTTFVGFGSKLVLILLMFIGRVGAVTLTIALVSKNRAQVSEIEYPDSKILVG